MAKTKIKIVYPDGKITDYSNVSDTYRKAISYFGVQNIRNLHILRNSINIVSTLEELQNSSGKAESKSDRYCIDGYYICTQFDTKTKLKILNEINRRLHRGLTITTFEDEN